MVDTLVQMVGHAVSALLNRLTLGAGWRAGGLSLARRVHLRLGETRRAARAERAYIDAARVTSPRFRPEPPCRWTHVLQVPTAFRAASTRGCVPTSKYWPTAATSRGT